MIDVMSTDGWQGLDGKASGGAGLLPKAELA
jgi:hypothetical protein